MNVKPAYWLWPLFFLLFAGTAGAQTYGMIGDSAAANGNARINADDEVCWYVGAQASVLYTASAGDTVTMYKAWLENGDSVSFGLYEFDLEGGILSSSIGRRADQKKDINK